MPVIFPPVSRKNSSSLDNFEFADMLKQTDLFGLVSREQIISVLETELDLLSEEDEIFLLAVNWLSSNFIPSKVGIFCYNILNTAKEKYLWTEDIIVFYFEVKEDLKLISDICDLTVLFLENIQLDVKKKNCSLALVTS